MVVALHFTLSIVYATRHFMRLSLSQNIAFAYASCCVLLGLFDAVARHQRDVADLHESFALIDL